MSTASQIRTRKSYKDFQKIAIAYPKGIKAVLRTVYEIMDRKSSFGSIRNSEAAMRSMKQFFLDLDEEERNTKEDGTYG